MRITLKDIGFFSVMAVVIPKPSVSVKSSGTVQKRMCVQWEPEWKYAPQANALT